MIQDIAPFNFDNQYRQISPQSNSLLAFVQDGKLLVKLEGRSIRLPCYSEIIGYELTPRYLFTVGTTAFYYLQGDTAMPAAEQLIRQ